jgi:MoaA/NifB/PqqE/SkfB family radical SAM enzyme
VKPQFVFVPTRYNVDEILDAFDLAVTLGCGAFVTGPLMRIGRAAADWERLGCSEETWSRATVALRERAAATRGAAARSIDPGDLVTEMETRRDAPPALRRVGPNGKVKLLNALPFSPADLRVDSLETAWNAYRKAWRAPEVQAFIGRCRGEPALLRHANETWRMGGAT